MEAGDVGRLRSIGRREEPISSNWAIEASVTSCPQTNHFTAGDSVSPFVIYDELIGMNMLCKPRCHPIAMT